MAARRPRPQLFVDLDGVLADFDAGATRVLGWTPVLGEPDKERKKHMWRLLAPPRESAFFESLPLCAGAERLWAVAQRHDAVVLTGCPAGDWAQAQKVRWCARELGLAAELYRGDKDAWAVGLAAHARAVGADATAAGGAAVEVSSSVTAEGGGGRGARGGASAGAGAAGGASPTAAGAGAGARAGLPPVRIVTCGKREKAAMALAWLRREGRESDGAVLVDDLAEQRDMWTRGGGDGFVFVHHTGVERSLQELRALGFE